MLLQVDARKKDTIRWDEGKGDYVFRSNNRRVSQNQLYKIIASEQKRFEQKQTKLANRFVGGQITFADWQRQSLQLVKIAHVEMARFARGGKDRTFPIQYLEVGNRLKQIHYPAHRNLARQLKSNRLTEAQFKYRVKLYGRSIRNTFEHIRASNYDSRFLVQRFLCGECKSCLKCIAYAARGKVEINEFIPPGTLCPCRMNCQCQAKFFLK